MGNNIIVRGSLADLAQQTDRSIAESFVNAELVCIIDTSGSMNSPDSRGGKTRYSVACEELEKLQAGLPGKVAVINFSFETVFEPGGRPAMLGGGTDLAKALQFAKMADVPGMRFVLISDGEPDDERGAMQMARHYTNRIDVVYVGPEYNGSGREFLARLAAATGGKSVTADRAAELHAGILHLLSA